MVCAARLCCVDLCSSFVEFMREGRRALYNSTTRKLNVHSVSWCLRCFIVIAIVCFGVFCRLVDVTPGSGQLRRKTIAVLTALDSSRTSLQQDIAHSKKFTCDIATCLGWSWLGFKAFRLQ